MSIRKGDTVIAGAYNLEKVQDGVARRNVGDVFWTMRKDTSNDGINGAYDCNGREFLSTDFQGDQSPYTLLVEGLLPSVTYEQYEQELTNNNGNCGYFALDTTAQKFKVPTYSEISILSGNLQDIGKYIPDGVPETALGSITLKGNVQSNGIAQLNINESGYNEQFYSNDMGLLSQEPTTEANVTLGNEVDQVKPKTITLRAMIQLATRGQDISIKQYTDQLDGLVEDAQESANLAQQAAINAAIILKGEYSTTVTYAMNNAVTVTTEEGTQYYVSLISDNLNNPVTDTTKWTPWIFIPFVQDGTTGLGVDIGTIITSLKTVPPTGFDKCDGTEVTKTQNENLYQACTSNVQLPVVSLTSLTLIGNSPCASSNENIVANQSETTGDVGVTGSVTFASDVKFYTMNGKNGDSFVGNSVDVSNQTVSIGYVGPTTGTEVRWVALGGQIPEGATHSFLVSDTPANKEIYEGTTQPDTSAYTGGSLALLWVDVENNKIYYKTRTAATETFGEWVEQTDAYIPLTLTSTNGTVVYSRYNNTTLEDLNDYSYIQYTSNGNCGYLGVDTTLEKVKLPTLNQIFLQGAADEPGLFMQAGLPNIEGRQNTISSCMSKTSRYGALSASPTRLGTDLPTSHVGAQESYTIDFDASLSNPIYGNSTTVQPESVCVNYYICTSPYSEVVAGATFTPRTQTVETGIELSWTNDKGLVNPTSVVIPKGEKGDIGPSNTLTVGTVKGGDTASATITGTSPNQTLNLVLPQGEKGDKGDKGNNGVGFDIGTVFSSLNSTPPDGCNATDGTEVTKQNYPDLYNACIPTTQQLTRYELVNTDVPFTRINDTEYIIHSMKFSDGTVIPEKTVTFAHGIPNTYHIWAVDGSSGEWEVIVDATVSGIPFAQVDYIPTQNLDHNLNWCYVLHSTVDGYLYCTEPNTGMNGPVYKKPYCPFFVRPTDVILYDINTTVQVESKLPTCTYEEYETHLTNNNGNCGYFGVDTVNEKIKLPTLDKVFLEAGNTGIGSYSQDQIVNITGSAENRDSSGAQNALGSIGSGVGENGLTISALRQKPISSIFAPTQGGNILRVGSIDFDASRVVNTGDRVKPRSIAVYFYVCLEKFTAMERGVTFTPSVSEEGVISWTNDGGLVNPDSVNIKGPQGEAAFSVEIGDVTSSTTPSVTNSGTAQNQIWDITLPKTLGLSLFDIVTKDHILTFEESTGLGLQGTYVYKTAVPGSRYGYPDFYDKCVEEFNDSTNQPVAVAVNVHNTGCVIDSNFIVSGFSSRNFIQPTSGFYPSYYDGQPFEVGVKLNTTTMTGMQSFLGGCDSNDYYGIVMQFINNKLRIGSTNTGTGWNLINLVQGTNVFTANTDYWFKFEYTGTQYIASWSTDGKTYTPDITIDQSAAPAIRSFCLGNNIYGAEDQEPIQGTIDLKECYIKINNEMVWQGTQNFVRNTNGHVYYHIAQKPTADYLYNTYGAAWAFGVDTENERILLPRNDWFFQSNNIDNIGKFNEAGLPNITGTVSSDYVGNWSGAFYSQAQTFTGNSGSGLDSIAFFDASRCSAIYGNSTTVQPNSVNLLLYIVVGNVISTQAQIDVVDVTSANNDTVPYGTGLYFDYLPNNVCWLRGGNQQNNEGLYSFWYTELVNELTTPKYNLKVIDTEDMQSGVDYSLYWKVDQDAMTFTTPTRTAQRVLVAKKDATPEDPTWYNWYSDGWLEQGGEITEVAVNESRTVNFPKPYLSMNYYPLTTPQNQGQGSGAYNPVYVIMQRQPSYMVISLNTANNLATYATASTWQTSGYGAIPQLSDYTEDIKLYFKIANGIQNQAAVNIGQITEALADKIGTKECKAYVVEEYRNPNIGTAAGNARYRKWSNGIMEQWSSFSNIGTNSTVKVNFLAPFTSNVCVYAQQSSNGTNLDTGTWTVSQVGLDGFNLINYTEAESGVYWYAIGNYQ